ncbi:hypothetical protein [Spongiimicrobium sp. 3-5]|uniref:hypothetical protein n=1 Tax=Spongiimicrobium sp. 3-5 TaxID=3332596 RepID=UPI00397ECC1E
MGVYLPLIIQLLTGALGGNVAGKLLKKQSLGTLGNSISGIVGGGLGGAILGMLGMAGEPGVLDMANVLGSIASGGVGGGLLMIVIGFIKNAISR